MWDNMSAAGAIGHVDIGASGIFGVRQRIKCLDNGQRRPPGSPMDRPSASRITNRQQRRQLAAGLPIQRLLPVQIRPKFTHPELGGWVLPDHTGEAFLM